MPLTSLVSAALRSPACAADMIASSAGESAVSRAAGAESRRRRFPRGWLLGDGFCGDCEGDLPSTCKKKLDKLAAFLPAG